MSLIDDLNTIHTWLLSELEKQTDEYKEPDVKIEPRYTLPYYTGKPRQFVQHARQLEPSVPIEDSLLDPDLVKRGSYKPWVLKINSKMIVSLPLELLNTVDQSLIQQNYPEFAEKLLPKNFGAKMAIIQTPAGRLWITDWFTPPSKAKQSRDSSHVRE